MAKSTHEKELERARRRRADERQARKRATTLVVALIVVLVLGAVGLGGVLLARGGGDAAGDVAIDDTSSDTEGDATSDDATAEDATDAAASMDTPQGVEAEPCEPVQDAPAPSSTVYDEQPTVELDTETVVVTLSTTCGDILLELDAAAAPATVGNFVALAEDGYYRGVGFHRVINGFMIQGGDPSGTGSGCLDDACSARYPGYQFNDELALAESVYAEADGYPRGTLAMANAGPNTNGSQFFIVQAEPGYPLPPQYAVFGRVLEGMEVVDRIAQGPVDGDLAVDPVVILGVDVQR